MKRSIRTLGRAGAAIAPAMFLGAPGYAQIPCHYEVAAVIQAPPCPIVGSRPTIGTGISPNGQYVCGFYYQCPGSAGYKAFVYKVQTGQFITLPFPPGVVSATAEDVNDNGIVVGQWEDSIVAGYRGYAYDLATGQYTVLEPLPGGAWSAATGVNSSGQVCGWRSTGSRRDPTYPWNAFFWSGTSAITDLGVMNGPLSQAEDISDDGTVVGWTGDGNEILDEATRGFVWHKGELRILDAMPGCTNSVAVAVNTAGVIVVRGKPPAAPGTPGPTLLFLFDGASTVQLPLPSGYDRCGAGGITNNGLVIGACNKLLNPTFHATIWKDGQAELLEHLSDPNLGLLEYVADADDLGQLLVSGSLENHVVTYLMSPTAPVAGDTNCDGIIDMDDLLNVIDSWGACQGCRGDLSGDGAVDLADLMVVIDNWAL